ncbi:cyclophilin family peptidyl-prolyl cis-trans isomerase [Porphyrobacter sp. MBR-155]|jgi:cyclophilin family peptidyl-prolyl cis-trans isomerase|uniref:esterase-like activity of phytase family protein n=1 Tax=Porphyrobacter sp. MBR-155 TaxID=3156464 RepID=UPI0033960389
MMRTLLIAAVGILLGALPAQAQPQDEFLPLTTPVELAEGESEAEVGELIFRGGVEIAPDKARIGGISSIEWHEDQLYAVADDGRWLVMTPEDVAGRLVDVSSVTIGDLRDAKGGKLGSKQRGDAEAITRLASGEWLIAFEQDHRIWRYAEHGGAATGSESGADSLIAAITDANGGIEALAAYDGGLLVCGEWADPARPNCLRITAAGAQTFHLPAPAGLAEVGGTPTDAACKGDGTCYVLFRSFTPGYGNRAAIVALTPDADPQTLAVLAPPLMLDNFEGLAVREAQGRTFLYLVSDDNFRNCETKPGDGCQRTLLMKFEIKGEPAETVPATPEAFAAAPTSRPGTRPFPDAASVSVVIKTTLGPITIALETERAPITAGNFLRYVDQRRLDGTTFYRAVRLESDPQPSGLVQGGTRGDPKRILPPITHEPTSQTGLTHTHGSVSMAMNAPGTADGDFFIMIEDQTGFDADPTASEPAWRAGFPVFGYVTDGMEVVAAIHAAPRDDQAGEGVMRGEMLAAPITIISARRAEASPPAP